MKPIMICALAFNLVLVSTAHAASNWRVMAVTVESANSPWAIEAMLNKYPELFAKDRINAAHAALSGVSISQITSLEIRSEKLKWVGSTICQKDDIRLIEFRATANIFNSEGAGVRFHEPAEEDPCLR